VRYRPSEAGQWQCDHATTPVGRRCVPHGGGQLCAQAAVDAANQEDVPTTHVRAPGRAVADANATTREPVTAARHQRLAQQ